MVRFSRRASVFTLSIVVACTGGITDDAPGDDEPACELSGPEAIGDDVDNDCDGLADEVRVCASGGAPFATIGAALASVPAPHAIEVCAGIYAEQLAIASGALHLRGEGTELTIIDAGGLDRAIAISGGAEVTIEGFTIRGGDTSGAGGGIHCAASGVTVLASALTGNHAGEDGGGLFAQGCMVEVSAVRFTDNDGGLQGGGLAVIDGAVTIVGSELRGNVAGLRGGAMYLASDAQVTGNLVIGNHAGWTGGGVHIDEHAPTLRDNTISENDAVEEGGGLYAHRSRAVLLDNLVADNHADDDGGGVRLFTSEARLERNRITGNHAGGDGGGIKVSHLPSLLVNNEVIDNVAVGAGGGLELDNDASVIRGGVISGNEAGFGGGIHAMLFPWNGGTIEDVRVTGNRAHEGGGILLENNFQPVVVRGVTLASNTADRGAGLMVRATRLTVANSLLVGNTAYERGGGLAIEVNQPWPDPCPCPPINPAVDIDFIVVHDNTAPTGSALWTDVPELSVESSILSSNGGTAVTVAVLARPRWRYNDTHPASFAGMTNPTGNNGNLATEPMFTDAVGGDFRLLAASRCIDAGDPALSDRDGSRADMGLYAGPGGP